MILFIVVVLGVVYLVCEFFIVLIEVNFYLNLSIIGVLVFGILFIFG